MNEPGILGPEPLLSSIGEVGARLRGALGPLLESIAGTPPRATRLIRATGLDKSLASRLVRAIRTQSDLELMHIVPSPTGLRILAHRAAGSASADLLRELRTAADRFQSLLDATPEGRAAIDAVIAESSRDVRHRREHMARQASFKSMSFVLGHYCDVLTTALFLVPSSHGRTIDGIEVQRRLGLRRLRPSAQMPLLNFHMPPEDEPEDDSTWIESVELGRGTTSPSAFLVPGFCSGPLPDLQVVRGARTVSFVLGPDPGSHAASVVTTSFRIRNGWALEREPSIFSVRGYVLGEPCRTVVRDLYLADGLFPGARPDLNFLLPLPASAETPPPPAPGETPHFSSVALSASIETRSDRDRAFELREAADQGAAVRHVLAKAGHEETRFRGWRVRIAYPVPLVEMVWWLDTR